MNAVVMTTWSGGDHRHRHCVEELFGGEPAVINDDPSIKEGDNGQAAPETKAPAAKKNQKISLKNGLAEAAWYVIGTSRNPAAVPERRRNRGLRASHTTSAATGNSMSCSRSVIAVTDAMTRKMTHRSGSEAMVFLVSR